MIRHFLSVILLSTPFASHAIAPEKLGAFAKQYCTDCHNSKKQKGEFNFEPLLANKDILKDKKAWQKVVEVMESHEMPPDDEKQPSLDERKDVIHWIDSVLAQSAAGEANPGRVTIRRLNRTEYRNTIRELLAVDFDPADFPQDETAHGFDTNADALTLPPILMERYVEAAEKIVTMAFSGEKAGSPVKKLRGTLFKSTNENVRPIDKTVIGFYREAEAALELKLDTDGEYIIKALAYGEQAGPEAPELAVSIDGTVVAEFSVPAVRKPGPYEKKLALKAGTHRLGLAYLNNYNDSSHPDPKLRGDRNLFIAGLEVTGPLHVTEDGPESYRRVFTKRPNPGEESAVARELLGAFATKAFRRPAEAGEIEKLGKFVDRLLADKVPFTEAISVGVQAVLCSPAFLFRKELDPHGVKPGEVRQLNEYEVASRLSYFLWSSMPDAELFGLAKRGELLKDGNLEKQTARMLKDSRVTNFSHNFTEQWLQIRAIDEIDIDRKKFPSFNDDLREAMLQESRLFFDAVLQENRSIFSLIAADFTFVNQRLARHYGITNVTGDQFKRVPLPPDSPRGGILGQAAVMLATSMPTRTSPVIRGKWVLEQILGTPPPPAAANVPPLEDAKVDKDAPLRVRLEQHRANAECAGCHAKIDPAGFALENFDAIGAWRTQDGNTPIDTSSVLPNGTKLAGLGDLKTYLQNEKFARAFAQNVATYALGRGLERFDRPAIDAIVNKAKADGFRIQSIITAVVTSDPFLRRKR
jgi:hypothetical protein